MSLSSESLDRISQSGEAVFATDCADRIIFWNKKCEELFRRPARLALGRRCHEVFCGRDVHGNLYCHRACPVAFQAREVPARPVNPFSLSIDVGGSERHFRYGMFLLPSHHRALSVLVHILREEPAAGAALSASEMLNLERLKPGTTAAGETFVLTRREREILACLAEGMESAAVAQRLGISRATVRNHIARLLRQLDVHSKLAAVVFAYQHNLIEPGSTIAPQEDPAPRSRAARAKAKDR